MNKKNIVLLAGKVVPIGSPTGNYVKLIADGLKDRFNVSIISIKTSNYNYHGEYINGIYHYTVSSRINSLCTFLSQYKSIAQSFNLFCKLLRGIFSLFSWPRTTSFFVDKAYNKLLELDDYGKIYGIISFSHPFSSHLASYKFKKKFNKVIWLTYTFDQYYEQEKEVNLINFKNFRNKKNLKTELDIINNSDYNIFTEELISNSKLYNSLKGHNIVSLPYLIPEIEKHKRETCDKIIVIYAGNFYKKIREPFFFLESFSNLNLDFELHLYTSGVFQLEVEEYVKQSGGRIIRHDFVKEEELLEIMNKSDFLINISNATLLQKPSKIFTYFATGKPIIDFYKEGFKDSYIERYPLAMQVNENKFQVDLLTSFLINNKGASLSYEEVLKNFPKNTKKYVINRVINLLNK